MFERWLKLNTPGAFALSYRLLNCRESALDVMQEASIAVWKKRESLSEPNEFRMFLFKVVRNKSIDCLRSQKVRRSDSIDDDDIIDEGRTPENEAEYTDNLNRLNGALLNISIDQREILLLKDWQGFSYDEIAKILEIERGTVMSRLHRARLHLAKQFEELESKKVEQ